MNNSNLDLLFTCGVCLVPFLVGIGTTLLVQKRIRTIGLPWALLPAGEILKALYQRIIEP